MLDRCPMFRALIELLVTILIVIVARAVLTSLLKAGTTAFRSNVAPRPAQSPNPRANASPGGDLHKDPVCGTYVAESTPFRQNISGHSFFYCSEACKEKHSLVAR